MTATNPSGANPSSMPPAAQVLVDFQPAHAYFVGIDSDGCAFDAMEIKHQECFTPNTIKWWDLQAVSKYARETALFVNLYSTTRGLNRWVALKRVFDLLRDRPEVKARGVQVPAGEDLQAFLDSGYPRSDLGIQQWASEHPSPEMEKCLLWGAGVNATIAEMVKGVPPFPGVLDTLALMSGRADLMVVSATPLEALDREWNEHGLAPYMSVIAGQEMGSKAEHVRYATTGKYDADTVLLIGDAPGDRDAAREAGCLYYPINPGAEEASWKRLHDEAFARFVDGTYAGDYQDALIAEFETYLPADPPWQT